MWWWRVADSEVFTVKSNYGLIENQWVSVDGVNESEERVFTNMWRSPTPSKAIALSWASLMDHIPTKTNLAIRQVLDSLADKNCVLCGSGDETFTHLFLHCKVVSLV